MEELYLIYINKVGINWREEYIYEFLFSNSIKDVDGEDWDSYPASGAPRAPEGKFINRVGVVTSKLALELIQNSDSFAVWDAVDGVIALAWEDLSGYDEYPEDRIHFKFGDTLQQVDDMLYKRDLVLDYTEIIKNK